MAGYTKEFLINVVMQRYSPVFTSVEHSEAYEKMLEAQYDVEGKDKFRVSASLDAAAIRDYKSVPKMSWSEALQKLS